MSAALGLKRLAGNVMQAWAAQASSVAQAALVAPVVDWTRPSAICDHRRRALLHCRVVDCEKPCRRGASGWRGSWWTRGRADRRG